MESKNSIIKILLTGFLSAISVSVFVVPMFKFGISPLPSPPSLLFAGKLLGINAPLPLGLLFHIGYIMIWTFIFLKLVSNITFLKTTYLALLLWIIAIVLFFPIVGWGFLGLGLGLGPKIAIAALVPHFLFDIFLWVYSHKVFKF